MYIPVEVTIGEPLCLVIARCYRLLRSLWRRAIKGTSGKPLGTSEKPLGTSGDRALLSAAAFVGTSESKSFVVFVCLFQRHTFYDNVVSLVRCRG